MLFTSLSLSLSVSLFSFSLSLLKLVTTLIPAKRGRQGRSCTLFAGFAQFLSKNNMLASALLSWLAHNSLLLRQPLLADIVSSSMSCCFSEVLFAARLISKGVLFKSAQTYLASVGRDPATRSQRVEQFTEL